MKAFSRDVTMLNCKQH